MKRVGAITIGQAPRTDVMEDIGDILGKELTLVQAGSAVSPRPYRPWSNTSRTALPSSLSRRRSLIRISGVQDEAEARGCSADT